ncbi:leucine-rich repeat receptor protein kinase EMS1-like [Rhododendron vialii]|uniref:leucine-rich repeat receptor protein kinase EMS1-like n=1 Tax=Rhododendron vialii TaxID=182163 RepID=UPI00265F6D84|nr:leucine-rich repeat receptor protein kinase EMS1-like [Rhododendron vialii]
MEPVLQSILAAVAAGFFLAMVLAAVCAARKNNRGGLPITSRTPAATERSSTFDPSALNPVSMPELLKATRNFSPDLIIGGGSFGLVYKARLPNATVAVKKLSPDAFQGFREFRAEMETLSKLRHPNIVTILGYCATGSDRVLIYEYIEKGSLDQWLLDTTSVAARSRLPLSWETRVNITRGVASGLAYMHNLETPIIHRDIKASHVLLDNVFEPHIAGFGLARRIEGTHSHVSTKVAGTRGYMPPEYIQGATMATAMGDVYSFGILMLQISTGIRPNLPFEVEEEEEGDGKEVRLVEWAKKKVAQDRHMDILDANISREGLKESAVVEFLRIAILCTSNSFKDRPPMMEVVELLNRISA